MRILLVEDEMKVASFIKKGLETAGYKVEWAVDGHMGLLLASDWTFDLIILDINLPKIDGLRVLQELRKKEVKTHILLLTVRSTIEDKVLGLDTGADDYLTKPFSFQELLARVRALMRRQVEAEPILLRIADLTLDLPKRLVYRGADRIDLTNKEHALLEYFMRNPGRVITRTMIAEHVWEYDFDPMTNIIDVYVSHLRKKIDTDRQPKLIHTVWGVGYVMQGE